MVMLIVVSPIILSPITRKTIKEMRKGKSQQATVGEEKFFTFIRQQLFPQRDDDTFNMLIFTESLSDSTSFCLRCSLSCKKNDIQQS